MYKHKYRLKVGARRLPLSVMLLVNFIILNNNNNYSQNDQRDLNVLVLSVFMPVPDVEMCFNSNRLAA